MSILGSLPTKQQIIDYLTEQNFSSNYACADGTQCMTFTKRVSPEAVNMQVKDTHHTLRWCEYDTANNRFVYECAYFDGAGQPITFDEYKLWLAEKFELEQKPELTDMVLSLYRTYGPESVLYFEASGENEWICAKPVFELGDNNKIVRIN